MPAFVIENGAGKGFKSKREAKILDCQRSAHKPFSRHMPWIRCQLYNVNTPTVQGCNNENK